MKNSIGYLKKDMWADLSGELGNFSKLFERNVPPLENELDVKIVKTFSPFCRENLIPSGTMFEKVGEIWYNSSMSVQLDDTQANEYLEIIQ